MPAMSAEEVSGNRVRRNWEFACPCSVMIMNASVGSRISLLLAESGVPLRYVVPEGHHSPR